MLGQPAAATQGALSAQRLSPLKSRKIWPPPIIVLYSSTRSSTLSLGNFDNFDPPNAYQKSSIEPGLKVLLHRAACPPTAVLYRLTQTGYEY
jgi:hypothetical protein